MVLWVSNKCGVTLTCGTIVNVLANAWKTVESTGIAYSGQREWNSGKEEAKYGFHLENVDYRVPVEIVESNLLENMDR
jgi:ABC-type phosphate transport system permease subunit